MSSHCFVEDKLISVVRGLPIAEEPGLGELTLSGFLREVTDRFSDREVLVQQNLDGTVDRCSYRELWERSIEVAKSLIACGLGKGERVGVLMTNRAEFLTAVFGTALAGGIAAPLSTFSTERELEQLVAGSACSVLLLERHILKKDFARILTDLDQSIGSLDSQVFQSRKFPYLQHLAMVDSRTAEGAIESWDSFLSRGTTIPRELVDLRAAGVVPADPGVLFFSSGTTNKPKGILSAHRGVSIQLWRMGKQQGLGDGVRSWTSNGYFWSGNFAMVVGGTLSVGGSLVLQRTFQPEEALELMASERVNFLFAWPHQWAQLEAAVNWDKVDLSALKYIDVSSPIARHSTVSTDWVEPRHCYGNTETFTISTAYPANTARDSAGGSHGLPLPGNTIKIVNPLTGKVVPVGQRGEIAVKGPTLMLGYLGVSLDQTFDDEGYFPTGDGGYVDETGRLFWEGRLNDIIKTGGANVSPPEIDEIIRQCPGVKVAQTVGVPHETLGELVVTCIVPHEGETLDEVMVRNFARQKLASYKVPRRVLFFAKSELKLTGSAKIKTSELRDLVAATLEAEGAD